MSKTISVEAFSDLVDKLYGGLQSKVPWKLFLEYLEQQIGASFSTLILRPPSQDTEGLILSTGGAHHNEALTSYNDHFFALDPFVDLPSGQVVTLDEFIPEDERHQSEYFQQFLAPINVHHILGADIHTPDGAKCSLRISRGSEENRFSDDDKWLINTLIPHLMRAVQLHMQLNRMEAERNLYAGAVDQLAVGTIILDDEGKVLEINQVAKELENEDDGLRVSSRTLHIGTQQDTRRFRELIKETLAHQRNNTPSIVQAMRVARLSGKRDLGIIIRSIPSSQWSGTGKRPCVAIFVSDPERQSQPAQDIVKTLFDLTPAEAQLAMHLANGLTLDEASETLFISRNTARAHLRSIFSKTGVTRQTMLVRLILKSVAPLG
ncbi:helix-turn-helix transcriptional regulator [Endozoicomonas sp.]|uniref:helix-turn-helix transcriptional regulator n=1 Tax=Endozoicomonas sp. TaxID=1892382 RepID=UPI003AF6C43E